MSSGSSPTRAHVRAVLPQMEKNPTKRLRLMHFSPFTSILFVQTGRITESLMPQQMETLYTQRSSAATRSQMNVKAPLCKRLCLNPISPAASSLYIKTGLRDQWSFAIDFLTLSFRQSLWAFPLLSNLSLRKKSPTARPRLLFLLTLFSHFCALTSAFPATSSADTAVYVYHRAEQTIRHFRKLPPLRSPLLPLFPLSWIHERHWFNRCLLPKLTVTSEGTSPSGCLPSYAPQDFLLL